MARSRERKERTDDGPPGAPEWVVTFTDMISLLVTFFVLLMTFSSIDTRDLLKVDAWRQRSTSMLDEEEGAVVQKTLDQDRIAARDALRGALQPHTRPPEELLDNLEEMGRKLAEDELAVDFSQHLDGLIVELDEEAGFDPGSALLPPPAARALTDIGRVLEHYPFLIVVEGFADGGFRPTASHPSAEAISCARAVAAAEHLLATTGVEATMVQVAGLGAAAPRAAEDTAEGRRANRRVRLRILSMSKLRATHVEALERAGGRR